MFDSSFDVFFPAVLSILVSVQRLEERLCVLLDMSVGQWWQGTWTSELDALLPASASLRLA